MALAWTGATASDNRHIGACLRVGRGGAVLLVGAEARTRPDNGDLMPGYAYARARQRGILMGGFVASLMDSLEALREPRTQAITLAIVVIVVALGCFRVASMIEPHHE